MMFDHFQFHSLLGGIRSRLLTCVALVDIRQLHVLPRGRLHRLREFLNLRPILFISRSDFNCQQVSQGIDGCMHLATFTALGSVITGAATALRSGLDRPTVQNNGAGFGIALQGQA